MIFEITRDYTIIVPLMISNLIAFFISQRLQPEPIYEALAHQEGVHLPTAESRAQAARIQVRQAMRTVPAALPAEIGISAALDRVKDGGLEAWPVADSRGLCGMVRISDLEKAASRDGTERHVSELVSGETPHLHLDHSLGLALERMGTSELHVLPVVSRANVRELLGVVALNDVLSAYGVAPPPTPLEQARG